MSTVLVKVRPSGVESSYAVIGQKLCGDCPFVGRRKYTRYGDGCYTFCKLFCSEIYRAGYSANHLQRISACVNAQLPAEETVLFNTLSIGEKPFIVIKVDPETIKYCGDCPNNFNKEAHTRGSSDPTIRGKVWVSGGAHVCKKFGCKLERRMISIKERGVFNDELKSRTIEVFERCQKCLNRIYYHFVLKDDIPEEQRKKMEQHEIS